MAVAVAVCAEALAHKIARGVVALPMGAAVGAASPTGPPLVELVTGVASAVACWHVGSCLAGWQEELYPAHET